MIQWFEETGLYPDQREKTQTTNYGRLVVLCYPGTEDIQRLLFAAQYVAVLFAMDEYYCDNEKCGAVPILVAPRLLMALAAMEPVYLIDEYITEFNQSINADPILVALRACTQHVTTFATPSQITRIYSSIITLFMGFSAEASWRINGTRPAVWEYLIQRHMNSFLSCITCIDVMEDYEVPTNIYYSPPLRRITKLASNASILANDIYSTEKESLTEIKGINLPQQMVEKYGCSLQEAIIKAAELHDASMYAYEAAERDLLKDNQLDPIIKRYLVGLKGFLGGVLEWQRNCSRYRVELT